MKTKGQLEYLKIRIFTNIEDDIETKYGLFSHGYDNGYFQCQEDMAEVIKMLGLIHDIVDKQNFEENSQLAEIYKITHNNSLNKQG